MNIEGKNIILTGASSGIGLALLKELILIEDTQIVAVARNIENIPILEGIIYTFSADLTKPEEIDRVFEFAQNTFGNIDIFIANAGFAYMEHLETANWQHNEKIFALNTLSPIYSLQKFISHKNENKEQYFVCISSAVSEVVLPYYSLYCSTKSAIAHFIRAYRYEAKKGLRIACVYPIATRTAFFEKAEKDAKPIIPFMSQDAEAVAKSIIRGIEKNKKEIYPSSLFRIFEYIGRIFPFVFTMYSNREKRKIDRKKNL